MAFLQAFTDDSASDKGDRRLFLAGYLNTAENWAMFADAWHRELSKPPTIAYLKMTEANGLRGQFSGWSKQQRDFKISRMLDVIKHFGGVSFQFSISRLENDTILKPYSPRGIGNAHFTTSFAVVAGLSQYVASYDKKLSIEFIFDEQLGVDADLAAFFSVMRDNLPIEAQNVISGLPAFKNDKDMYPLQAADMLAWHLRREHESGIKIENSYGVPDKLRSDYGHLIQHIDKVMIERWAKHHKGLFGVELTQSKSQWQKIRKEFSDQVAAGYFPSRKDKFRYWMFKIKLVWSGMRLRRKLRRQSERRF